MTARTDRFLASGLLLSVRHHVMPFKEATMKTTLKHLYAATAISLVFLHGCSSAPTAKSLAKEEAQLDQQRREAAQTEAEKAIDAMPSWATATPRPDSTGIFAIGIGESDKLPLAMKKAQLQAEYALAKNLQQELAGNERMLQQDSNGSASGQYDSIITSLVDYVSVVGCEEVKRQTVAVNGRFQTYILLKMPYEAFNQALQAKKAQTRDNQLQQAYNRLERQLEQRRRTVTAGNATHP